MDKNFRVDEARANFAEVLNSSQWMGEHVRINRHGKTAGVLVPLEWYDRAVEALEEQHRDMPAS